MEPPPPFTTTPDQYVDQIKYVVRLTDHPAFGVEGITEGYVVVWGELGVPLDQAAGFSRAVAWNPERGYYESFVAEQSYTHFEWGASGYGVSFLVDVINSISSELVVAGLTYAVTKMRGEKERHAPWVGSAEDLASARVDAVAAVASVFAEKQDDLSVQEATHVGDAIQVRLRGANGIYIATLTALETGDAVCHVKRAD